MGAGSEIREHWAREEQLDSDAWKHRRRANQATRERRLAQWSDDLRKLTEAGLVSLAWFSPYHVRVTPKGAKRDRSIDVYPSTARWLPVVTPKARVKWSWSGLMCALGISEDSWKAALRVPSDT